MTFDEILDGVGEQQVLIPEGWGQGRATFGGLIGAVMFRRLRQQVPEGVVRALSVSFVGPVAPGAATLQAQVLRAGKSVTQVECRLLQGDDTLAVMLASFGAPRDSTIALPGPEAPSMRPPERAFAVPKMPGMTPEFLDHFDLRWAEGDAPFAGSRTPGFGGWMRFTDTPRSKDSLEALLALIDAWPPAVLPLYDRPAPSSSLTWYVEFLQERPVTGDWWQYRVSADAALNGYASTEARIWNDRGEPVAISRQVVTVFV